MKNRLKDKIGTGTLFRILVIMFSVFMLTQNFPFCKSITEKAAVLSSKTVLVGAKVKNKDEAGEEKSHTESTENSKETEKSADNDGETQPAAEETAKNEPVQSSSLIDENFTSEPDDIKKLTQEYSSKADKDKKDGPITEVTFTTAGVTDSYKNVKVKNVNDTKINIKKLLSKKADITVTDKSQPTVLIFHTHTTEAYQILDRSFYAQGFITRSEDSAKNMIRVGEAICEQLEKAGYKVLHDKTIYDKQYNGAYDRSREKVREYLKKYPSIQVVLDIHRDAIQYTDGTKVKPVSEIMGKKCAQMMIISGCQESGNGISGFDDWEYNLVFALHLQKKLEDIFPGITRPLYFCPRKYVMNESHCNLLIEMGTDANTLSEGVYSGKCLGTALASLLDEYVT